MKRSIKRILLESAVISAAMVAGQVSEQRPARPHTEKPRREPLESKPQREKREPLTDDDRARIQAAEERRKRRNAKRKGSVK